MTEPDWFSVVEGGELEQGDLLRDCPVPVVHAPGGFAEDGEVDVDIQIHDLCVLTQSCDLANAKVDTILLGRVVSWSDLVEAKKATDPGYGSQKMRVKVRQGLLPDVCLLHRRKSAPKLAWSVVEFHHLYVLPRVVVTAHAAALGPRLRLESPYREHLAQALARFFMRVGLPHDARTFDGDPGPP